MNILFLSLSKFENLYENQIYNDIFKELAKRGHKINIICPQIEDNRRDEMYPNIHIHRVSIGEVRNVNKIIKGIKTITLEKKYKKVIKQKILINDIDVIMYSTPPITFNNIIKDVKRINKKVKSVLLLKDIFPQNAIDLNFMKQNSIIHRYFSRREKALYIESDIIGCMSEANKEFLIKNHPYINKEKIFIFRNSLYKNSLEYKVNEKIEIFDKYGLDSRKILFIYGGNLGKPQYFEGIKNFINNFNKVPNSQLLIIGDGTEFENLDKLIEGLSNNNIHLHKKVTKNDFDKIMNYADVGLIFLDPRFTIPNFPSRFTSYLDFETPVLAATDNATDIKKIIEENGVGFWNHATDCQGLIESAIKFCEADVRNKCSQNAKALFESDYSVQSNVDTLIRMIKNYEKKV